MRLRLEFTAAAPGTVQGTGTHQRLKEAKSEDLGSFRFTGEREGDGDGGQGSARIRCRGVQQRLKQRRGREGRSGHLFCMGAETVAAWTVVTAEEAGRL